MAKSVLNVKKPRCIFLCYINAVFHCPVQKFPLPQGHAHSLQTHPSSTRRLLLVEDVGEVAATAVLAVVHGSHEDTGTALKKKC